MTKNEIVLYPMHGGGVGGGEGGSNRVMSAWIGMRDWLKQAFQNVGARQMKMLWDS